MSPNLTGALESLRDDLAAVRLDLEVAGAPAARRVRDDVVAQVDDYLLPRLRRMDAPVLIVVGGSTGAGKSTLLNSLVGLEISPAGVLRPTTLAPVLACNPDDVHWFENERVLPGLARTTGATASPGTLHLVPTTALSEGLALLDSPDIDSVLAENRTLANQLLAAADAWLFVTTAARYADAVPWEFLHAARDRGTSLSVVLNRVPADAGVEVPAHLQQMLRGHGLDDVDLLVVPETEVVDGLIREAPLEPVRRWLDTLAADAQARAALVRRTLRGAVASLPGRAGLVERAAVEQLSAAGELRADVEEAYTAAVREVDAALRSGSLLRGEVLARWHEVIGTGDVMRTVESRVGALRDRLRTLVTNEPPADRELQVAVENRVEAVVRAAAERAAERAARAWRERPSGKALLEEAGVLESASPELAAATEDEVRDWQTFVFELVRSEAIAKRTTARLASLGVNGAGLAVMLAVFAHTGGLTGAEVVVAGGTSAVGQKVLEAILGDQAVRTLATRAREELVERAEQLLRDEATRFQALLDAKAPDADAFARLHAAIDAVRRAS
ncbi:MAG: ABC transporter [Thermoleophilia bacterium]|nr:ABC transporter [Thermoleophilia bacterium]